MKKPKRVKLPIGWREWVGFPEFGDERIKAKIDTGARTSSIHAFRIRKIASASGPQVEFYLHPVQHRRHPEVRCIADLVDERVVKSSNGEGEMRYVIETPIRLGTDIWPVEFTLSNRDQMGFRLLIGRAAIRNKFIVDPGSSYKFGR